MQYFKQNDLVKLSHSVNVMPFSGITAARIFTNRYKIQPGFFALEENNYRTGEYPVIAKGTYITVIEHKSLDYCCLTDISNLNIYLDETHVKEVRIERRLLKPVPPLEQLAEAAV